MDNQKVSTSGVGSILQVGGTTKNFFTCPLTFLSCRPHEGYNDCLLPTEKQLKW